MGNKKLWLVIVLLFVSSALFGEMETFLYLVNGTEQQFSDMWFSVNEGMPRMRIKKLPNTIIQAINDALNDYSLEVGDMFKVDYEYNNTNYEVLLRITDARNKRWQWYCVAY